MMTLTRQPSLIGREIHSGHRRRSLTENARGLNESMKRRRVDDDDDKSSTEKENVAAQPIVERIPPPVRVSELAATGNTGTARPCHIRTARGFPRSLTAKEESGRTKVMAVQGDPPSTFRYLKLFSNVTNKQCYVFTIGSGRHGEYRYVIANRRGGKLIVQNVKDSAKRTDPRKIEMDRGEESDDNRCFYLVTSPLVERSFLKPAMFPDCSVSRDADHWATITEHNDESSDSWIVSDA